MNRRCQTSSKQRTAIAVVELAICLPFITLITFGTLEACRAVYLRQNLTVVAYEGARIGILPGASQTALEAQCDMMLNDRGIKGYTVSVTPAISSLSSGEMLNVTVSAKCNENSMVSNMFFQDKIISETVVLRAE